MTSVRVSIRPELYEWACERAGGDVDSFTTRFPKLPDWMSGEAQPTLKQLEAFAAATHAPVGALFLSEPPHEALPLPDFRRVAGNADLRPSGDLLDTIYLCQARQEWYRDFARSMGERPLPFVGSATVGDNVVETARAIRRVLSFALEEQTKLPSWSEAFRHFVDRAEDAGVLVMCSGIVQNDTHRKLDPQEFRGFAMVDDLAPVVFVNGADTKAAQMFTLAHELAHVWLGESAVSDADATHLPKVDAERWCNEVAAELLVPLSALSAEYDPARDLGAEKERLARRFKVSTLVILRRIHDAGGLSWNELRVAYDEEMARLVTVRASSGGNFYLSLAVRVSKRFARALIVSTAEGQTLYRDAFRLLGSHKADTFEKFGVSLGVL